jgi:formylglycine-generating enzyme required for sulfatase activity
VCDWQTATDKQSCNSLKCKLLSTLVAHPGARQRAGASIPCYNASHRSPNHTVSDIFLSYARSDLPRVKPLVDSLSRRGWSVWWDNRIPPGKTWDQVIEKQLKAARCVLVLWSKHSVQRHWVLTEAHYGLKREILVPALLDDTEIPLAFERIQAANLTGWRHGSRHSGFDDLVQGIGDILEAGSPRALEAAAASDNALTIEPPPVPSLVAAQTRVNPRDGLTYVWISPGKFTMGCSPGDNECDEDERPPHEVTITRGFWLGQTPVTQAAYRRFLNVTGKPQPEPPANPDLPVVSVTWDEAQAYCQWAETRLPTEAEWEYAARAGTTGAHYGPLDDIAWYIGNSGKQLHPVRGKQPNRWGLYDMLGNVWEWVADWYGQKYYERSAGMDPAGPASGQYRALRGGSWSGNPQRVRVSVRLGFGPTNRYANFGFRCAEELRL